MSSNCLGKLFGVKRVKDIISNIGKDFLHYPIEKIKSKLLLIDGFQIKLVDKLIENIPIFLKYLTDNPTFNQLYKLKKDSFTLETQSDILKDISVCFSGYRNKEFTRLH